MGASAIIEIGLGRCFGACLFWDTFLGHLRISLNLPFFNITINFKKKTEDCDWVEFYNSFNRGGQ